MMKILNDLISTLDPETRVREIRQGVFHTGVLTRNCGLASSLPRDALRQERPLVKEPGTLVHKSALELAQMAHSESILEAAVGMATINSLLDINEGRFIDLNARELIAEKGRGKRVAIVGHFPFIPKIREVAKELWVIEKNPREGDFIETEAEDLIPKADVVAITGTSLTNQTFEHLIGFCDSKASRSILGIGDTKVYIIFIFKSGKPFL